MYILHTVHPQLAPFIDSYWESTFEQMLEPRYDELFVAQLYPNIIVNLSADYHRNDERIASTTLIGINTLPIHFLHQSTNQLFGIRFKPSGLSVFFPLGLHEIADNSVNLQDIFGQKGVDLAEKIIEASTTADRIKITEGFLLQHLNVRSLDKWQFYQLAQDELKQLCIEPNAIPLIVKKMNTTQRTFDRHFQQILGLSPKKISRLLRFQRAFDAMHQPHFKLNNFNYHELGYYDQAHFSKEFKEFSGFAPASLFGLRVFCPKFTSRTLTSFLGLQHYLSVNSMCSYEISTCFHFLLFALFSLNATDYYLSNAGNNSNNGTSSATPWQTLTKLSAELGGTSGTWGTISTGDRIFFRKGDVFRGSIAFSAYNNNGITFDSYGSGATPIIKGSTLVTTWTVHSGSIWKATLAQRPYFLYDNASLKTLARAPNTGTWNLSAATGTSLTSAAVGSSGKNFVGANACIREYDWQLNRQVVTAQSSNTVNWGNSINAPSANANFYFDNKLELLDTEGEWFWDSGTNTLYYMSATNPNTLTIEVSTNLLGVAGNDNRSNNVFQNLQFEHFAQEGIRLMGSANDNTIQNCVSTTLIKPCSSVAVRIQFRTTPFQTLIIKARSWRTWAAARFPLILLRTLA